MARFAHLRASPGAPIAYKLSYLKDNSTVNQIAVDSAGGDDDNADLELYGQISAEGTGSVTLLDKTRASWVRIKEGRAFGDGITPLAEGVIDVAPESGQAIKAPRSPDRPGRPVRG